MKLEDQVCSLELSKKLKELGIKQESLFFWEVLDENAYGIRFEVKFLPFSCPGIEKYSAFTASELLEILPIFIGVNSVSSYRFSITRALYVENTEPEKITKSFIINYVNDCLSPNITDDGKYEWPTSFINLMRHNIFDKNLSNACAKMLIYIIENNIWKPEI